ncbi:RhuM family protein [Corynebacterium auriscanis]|uniref:2-hydroxyacid dehydrogenase n=1 Tax=Corynebacterium auriscanis TaxID=99807 RepID=A0A0A2DMN6_9CORY|nr:RhuM family protein [Corynebacterium auriscanis]KGM18171.1 hypothetical protein MA47_09860 [Corynebacterium auriscanis]WJY73264.1 hypothetical protein CAURIC_08255 [Corynebacterium auriscanis]
MTTNDKHDQIAIYTTEDGAAQVRLQLKDGTAWLTQKQMSELFNVGVSSISKHLKNTFDEGELNRESTVARLENVGVEQGRTVTRTIEHYNLDAILAVGYRVRGQRGTQFRKWATEVLREYLVKGFAMDDQRLKNDGIDTHFDELLERIREIRASERQMFRKVLDVITATSDDYHEVKDYKSVKNFFAGIQNRLHYATHGKTAAELIWERADNTQPNAGLTTWDGEKPHKKDMITAKNYLHEDEAKRMNRLTSMFLDYAEDQAEMRKTLLLEDWVKKTDAWLVFNERQVLQGFGTRKMTQAQNKALSEWDAYQRRLDNEVNEIDMRQLESEVRELNKKQHRGER